MSRDAILKKIGDYYSARLREHGPTARGVDWNSHESQFLRFEQLLKIKREPGPASFNEIGCGYGAFVDFLDGQGEPFSYCGVDLAPDMVAAANARFVGRSNVCFEIGTRPAETRDFSIASGVFNVRLDTPDEAWLDGIHAVMDTLHETSSRGFAFNALTSYSDADKMRDYLYYADPLQVFDRCKRRYSGQVALLHDYGLYEFTIVVRKDV
jgi:SAM-dependent methyltransferase